MKLERFKLAPQLNSSLQRKSKSVLGSRSLDSNLFIVTRGAENYWNNHIQGYLDKFNTSFNDLDPISSGFSAQSVAIIDRTNQFVGPWHSVESRPQSVFEAFDSAYTGLNAMISSANKVHNSARALSQLSFVEYYEDLSDTPASLAGGLLVGVNAAGDAMQFYSFPSTTFTAYTDTLDTYAAGTKILYDDSTQVSDTSYHAFNRWNVQTGQIDGTYVGTALDHGWFIVGGAADMTVQLDSSFHGAHSYFTFTGTEAFVATFIPDHANTVGINGDTGTTLVLSTATTCLHLVYDTSSTTFRILMYGDT